MPASKVRLLTTKTYWHVIPEYSINLSLQYSLNVFNWEPHNYTDSTQWFVDANGYLPSELKKIGQYYFTNI